MGWFHDRFTESTRMTVGQTVAEIWQFFFKWQPSSIFLKIPVFNG